MLHTLAPHPKARKNKKRVGRGDGSGHGSFSTRGCKGQNSRAGSKFRPGFEGNQTPLIQRLPQLRGFNNVNKVFFQVVNIADLDGLKSEKVTIDELKKSGLISSTKKRVKILGYGELKKKLHIEAHACSAQAKEAIEKAGGTIELLK
ncbi:MAG: 50S ribosomal protein L15 [Candidatus Abawacabacteria bacterium]|nr:50S ribosomal protein L15 [Candidatus Abawacabacteria bacterium]